MTNGVRSGWIENCIESLYHHTMEMDQTMARLLIEMKAEITADREEITARLEAMVDAKQEKMEARMDGNNEKF
jgi:Spy/CpxP family protein refolding chaperone